MQFEFILGKVTSIKRADLFDIAKSICPLRPRHTECQKLLLDYILYVTGNDEPTNSTQKLLTKVIDSFTKNLTEKWNKARRFETKFKKNNEQWLSSVIVTSSPDSHSVRSSSSRVGRPKISFEEGSEVTKRRRVQEEVSLNTEDELCLATEIKLRKNGKRDVASMLHKMRFSPKTATRLKKLETRTEDLRQVSFSPEEALALFVGFKFTRYQYIGIRNLIVKKGLKKIIPDIRQNYRSKKKNVTLLIFWLQIRQSKYLYKIF